MMATEVKMPQLGESVTEGTVVRWLKQPGEHVALDESLAEVETEKVNVEIPSPFEGTLTALLVPEGETVAVGVPIAAIEVAGAVPASSAAAAAPPTPLPPSPREPVASAPTRRAAGPSFSATGPLGPQDRAHGMFSTGESQSGPAGAAAESPPPAPRTGGNGASADGGAESVDASGRFSPAVLRLAREQNVDLKQIRGSGLGGRITRKDVQAFIDHGGAAVPPAEPGGLGEERRLFTPPMAEPVAPLQERVVQEVEEAFEPPIAGAPPAVNEEGPAQQAPAQLGGAARQLGPDEELEPLTATRRAIAAHMLRSVQTSPHAWMMVEVDVTRLVEHRSRIKDEFKRREGVDLSYLPFMIKATVAALKQHPRLNSSWSDDGVILKRRINVGIAVDTEQGLVVPVIHDADNYSVAGLAKRLDDLVARARSRRLKLEDVQGGTFTVDNVGPIGSVLSQPIINQPQCAIVTMESIVRRPVVLGDAIAVRSMMNCCLSFDHRIVDGGDVGPFMKTLKRNLEVIGDETPIY
jgi:2-oxoisovalerate dehydrogenase E2 component (dihydrolipoyl transacylase)